MVSMVQDSVFGQLVRLATKGRVFAHEENDSNFQLPWKREANEDSDKEKELEAEAGAEPGRPLRRSAEEGTEGTPPDADVEQQNPIEQQQSRVLQPQKTPEGIILIDWYTSDDKANPQNWSSKKKATAALIINLYTFGVYSCSSIITPAHGEIMERFNVSYAEASLGLSMYVIGYGIGPLVSTSILGDSSRLTDVAFLSSLRSPGTGSQHSLHYYIRTVCYSGSANCACRQLRRPDCAAIPDGLPWVAMPCHWRRVSR